MPMPTPMLASLLVFFALAAGCGASTEGEPSPAIEGPAGEANAETHAPPADTEAHPGADTDEGTEGTSTANAAAESVEGTSADVVADAPATSAENAAGDTTGDATEDGPLPTPPPGSLRLVVVSGGELLGSEERALAAIETRLARGRTLTRAALDAPEVAVARAWLEEGTRPHALPSVWLSSETVVVLRVATPRVMHARGGRHPARRVSRGLAGMLVFRWPDHEPIFESRVGDPAATDFRDERLADRVVALVP